MFPLTIASETHPSIFQSPSAVVLLLLCNSVLRTLCTTDITTDIDNCKRSLLVPPAQHSLSSKSSAGQLAQILTAIISSISALSSSRSENIYLCKYENIDRDLSESRPWQQGVMEQLFSDVKLDIKNQLRHGLNHL